MVSGKDNANYNTLATVTNKCFFDISIDGRSAGRMIIGLFGWVVPLTVRNFKELCGGDNGKSKYSGYYLSYEGTIFHKITTDFMAEGGDIYN